MTYTPEQIAENRRKWVAELRSGKYGQCTGRLVETDANDNPVGYCCLGVAVEFLGLDERTGDSFGALERLILTENAKEALGLFDKTPGVHFPDDTWEGLADLNDAGVSFDDIADLIEAQPPEWTGQLGPVNNE